METKTTEGMMPMSKEELNDLLKETKETIATEMMNPAPEFKVVDMWKVRKASKPAMVLRRWLN
ncbi:MAG: hypothetical protein WAT19_10405 [Ferruginibacter sp.]